MKCEILLQVKLLICTGKQNATIDDISGGDLGFEIRAEGIACRHWIMKQWLFLADTAW